MSSNETTTMQAIVQESYGNADVLHTAQRPRPEPGANEVLLQVRAAGLDRGTWHLMAGLPYLMRPFVGFRGPRNPVPGLDVAGVVEAVGEKVTRVRRGRRGVRLRQGHVRGVRRRTRGPAGPEAEEPLLRAGRRRPGVGIHRARRPDPGRRRAARTAGAGHRGIRRRRAATPYSSRRPSAPRSPACAARPRSTWCGPWVRNASSTTPATTGPTAATTTTWSSTSEAGPRFPGCAVPSPPTAPPCSSAGRTAASSPVG